MPRVNFNIIEHYQETEPELATRWLRLLNKEMAEKNLVGPKKLYHTLKTRVENRRGEYPTRRFIIEFLQGQQRYQTFKQTRKHSDTIQSVVANRPNQLIQCDFLYFFWGTDSVPGSEVRSKGPIDEEGSQGRPADPEAADKLRATAKEFGTGRNRINYRGCITAIDCFTRRGYAVPILGNINSTKATEAIKKILAEADGVYGQRWKQPRTIQTDKGSEFANRFRNYLNDLKDRTPKDGKGYFYKHQYSYTGKSAAAGVVERFNGTVKRGTMRALGNKLGPNWTDTLKIVVRNYNDNFHSTIQRSPNSVATVSDAEIIAIRNLIVSKAVRQHTIDMGKFKPGDYVRLRVFKPKRLEPNFTDGSRVGSDREDLRRLIADNQVRPDVELDEDEFAGVYLVHSVRLGRTTRNNTTQPGKATTYQLVAAWSKESQLRTLPSGQKKNRTDQPAIRIKTNNAFIGSYPKAAYIRSFTKDSLSRVPQDSDGLPIVNRPDDDRPGEYIELEEVIRVASSADSRSKAFRAAYDSVSKKKQGEDFYLTRWAGFKTPEWVPESDIRNTTAFEKFRT